MLAVGAVLLVVALGGSVYVSTLLASLREFHTVLPGQDEPGAVGEPRPDERINILFLGVDACQDPKTGRVLDVDVRDCPSRTDTIIVVSMDPETREAGLVSIPRDTRVAIPGHGWQKAGHAHAYGGPALAMATVEKFLGIRLHYFVRTNFAGFARLVDSLGGVELCVEKDMYYEDPAQDLVIDLKAGCQLLNGDQALQYVRYRNDSDIARVQRQQNFIRAVVDRLYRLRIVFRLHQMIADLVPYVDTNLEPKDMLRMVRLATKVDDADGRLEMAVVPGRDAWLNEGGQQVSYWVADPDGTREVVDTLLRGIDREKNAQIRVQVLNGTAIPGLGGQMAARLEAYGFQVVQVANAERQDYVATKVIGHTGDRDQLRRVGRAVLEVASAAELVNAAGEDASADVTVIVGPDTTLGVGKN